MKQLIRSALRRLMTGSVFAVLCVTQATAFDEQTLRTSADAGNPEAQRVLGEALITGSNGVNEDSKTGAAYLARAVAQGDVSAKVALGTFLLDGVLLDRDPTRGKALLEQAAAAGDTTALTELGAALLWGTIIDQDTARAAELLKRASDAGDVKAMHTLGEAMIVGLVKPKDVSAGLSLMENAAASGNAKAQIALGKLLLEGEGLRSDFGRATALFEAAAQSGDGEGLEILGSHLMWVKRNKRSAEGYLWRAGELGEVTAWETLAAGAMYGYLGNKKRKRFEEFAQKAREAGSERIEVLDAERRMWGISMRANGPKTVAMLEDAAGTGNKQAFEKLIALVRDGNRYNVRRSSTGAQSYLERYADLLSPSEIQYYSLSIDAAKTRVTSRFTALAARYRSQDRHLQVTFAEDFYAANPNLVIYMLQEDMTKRGEYRGKLNGLATRNTINALARACSELPYTRGCNENVLAPKVIADLLTR